jgi:hypothetical protein
MGVMPAEMLRVREFPFRDDILTDAPPQIRINAFAEFAGGDPGVGIGGRRDVKMK